MPDYYKIKVADIYSNKRGGDGGRPVRPSCSLSDGLLPRQRSRLSGTPWLHKYLRIQGRIQRAAHANTDCTKWVDCLAQCSLHDGYPHWGQFCIDKVLGYDLAGDVRKGLFFRLCVHGEHTCRDLTGTKSPGG